MSSHDDRPRTRDLVVKRSNRTRPPVEVGTVYWTPKGDQFWFTVNGRSYGPKKSSDYVVVTRREDR